MCTGCGVPCAGQCGTWDDGVFLPCDKHLASSEDCGCVVYDGGEREEESIHVSQTMLCRCGKLTVRNWHGDTMATWHLANFPAPGELMVEPSDDDTTDVCVAGNELVVGRQSPTDFPWDVGWPTVTVWPTEDTRIAVRLIGIRPWYDFIKKEGALSAHVNSGRVGEERGAFDVHLMAWEGDALVMRHYIVMFIKQATDDGRHNWQIEGYGAVAAV